MQANFLWAYATLGKRLDAASLGALEAAAHKLLPQFDSQALSNMLWAFVKLDHMPGSALLRGCEAQAVHTAANFSPQGLVRCIARLVHEW